MSTTYRRILLARARASVAAFAEYLGDLAFPPYLREICRFANEHARALILAPRGFAKTTAAMYLAAHLIGVSRGHVRIGILTAVDDDAIARSRAIRQLVEAPRYAEVFPWARGEVAGPHWRDDAWTVRGVDLGKDVTCRAMSLGSVRAGPRLDLLLADDPVGFQENASGGARAKALEVVHEVVLPMLVPGAQALVLGTRWHEDDLYASLIERGWATLLRRAIEDGVPLWPERFSLDELARLQTELGTPIFNLQYLNDPSGLGGTIFRREWFRYVDEVPTGARRAGLDLNASASERADYTALVEWVEDDKRNLYFVGAWRKRLDEGHRRWLTGRTDSLAVGVAPVYGEPDGPCLLWPLGMLPPLFAAASGDPSRPRSLTRLTIETVTFESTFVRELIDATRLPAVPVRPDRDKVSRARALAARYEAGKVFHLRSALGLTAYEQELVAFPNGEHDDQVDAAVYGADLGAPETPFVPRLRFPGIITLRRGAHARGAPPYAPPFRTPSGRIVRIG